MDNIISQLQTLAELQDYLDTLRLQYAEIEKEIIPPEIARQLDELRTERDLTLSAAQAGITRLQDEIKAAVIQAGKTVKGDRLQAVFTPGRTTWDTQALDGYAAAHPKINQFRRVGIPSVTLRIVK